jgi:hypothetical protein
MTAVSRCFRANHPLWGAEKVALAVAPTSVPEAAEAVGQAAAQAMAAQAARLVEQAAALAVDLVQSAAT